MKPKSWAELVKTSALRVVTEIKSISRADGGTLILFRASTAAVDRDGESIDPMGWTWNESKLPNFLYGHNGYDPENWLGKGAQVYKDPTGLYYETMLFDQSPAQTADLARQVKWIAENHADALSCSVGFRPLKWQDANGQVYTIDDLGSSYPWSMPGRKYLAQELLEVSAVPVPSNIEALAVQVRGLIARAGIAPPAPAAAAPELEPVDRLKALADELGVDLEVVEYDPAWLAVGIKKPLPRPIAKVGAVLSQANKTRLQNAHAACTDAASSLEKAMGHLDDCMGSATTADESVAA